MAGPDGRRSRRPGGLVFGRDVRSGIKRDGRLESAARRILSAGSCGYARWLRCSEMATGRLSLAVATRPPRHADPAGDGPSPPVAAVGQAARYSWESPTRGGNGKQRRHSCLCGRGGTECSHNGRCRPDRARQQSDSGDIRTAERGRDPRASPDMALSRSALQSGHDLLSGCPDARIPCPEL